MLTSADLASAIARIHAGIGPIADALNAADRPLGDGDTGMTVAEVVGAWHSAEGALPVDVGAALLALGRETGRASGSSLGAVLAMGFSAAGRSVRGKDALDRAAVAAMLGAAAATIASRSGATAGDKSILDSLLRVERAIGAADDAANLLDVANAAAAAALAEFRDREARLGRARMYGAKSIGHDDPGMLAAVLLLNAAAAGSGGPRAVPSATT